MPYSEDTRIYPIINRKIHIYMFTHIRRIRQGFSCIYIWNFSGFQ